MNMFKTLAFYCILAPAILSTQPIFAQDYATGLAAARDGDYATAYQEWLPLAEQGDVRAQFNVGVLYDYGRAVPQDHTIAAGWFRKAAEQGDAEAQYNLGVALSMGEGVAQDHQEAAKWFLLAANQGVAQAQYNLGLMYDKARGLPQDYESAVKWYRRAAEQGEREAQHNLGAMYYYGQGVIPDKIIAYMWFEIAHSAGYEPSIAGKNVLVNQMSPSDIAKAGRLADECVMRELKGC